MGDNGNEKSSNKLLDKISEVYKDGPDSYEFPIDDGNYWRKVRRYKEIKNIIKNK